MLNNIFKGSMIHWMYHILRLEMIQCKNKKEIDPYYILLFIIQLLAWICGQVLFQRELYAYSTLLWYVFLKFTL